MDAAQSARRQTQRAAHEVLAGDGASNEQRVTSTSSSCFLPFAFFPFSLGGSCVPRAGQGSTLCASRERRHACLEQRFSPPDVQIVRPGPLLEACRPAPLPAKVGGVVKRADRMHGQVRSAELKADQGAAAGLPGGTQQHSTVVADAAADPRRATRSFALGAPWCARRFSNGARISNRFR